MLAVSRTITNALIIASLLLPGVAVADVTDTCFNFLDAQDNARAESEAKTLLNRKHAKLSRTEQRYAQLCLGRAYSDQGRAGDALPAFLQVESLSKTTEELASAYLFLGGIYYSLGDLDHAELYDQRAIKTYKDLGSQSKEASALNNLALVLRDRGDTDRALALLQESLTLQPEDSVTLNSIATIYHARKDYPKAIETFRKGIEISRREGAAHNTATFQINLGEVLRLQGELQESENELTAGLNAIRLVGDKNWEAKACWSFTLLNIDQKNIPVAREWAKKAEVLYREIGNTAKADAIAKQLSGK